MFRRLLIFLLTAAVVLPCPALAPAETDSVAAGAPRFPVTETVAAASLVVIPAAVRTAYPRDVVSTDNRELTSRGTDYLQYAPIAVPWVMKVCGQETRSSWLRMATSNATSVALMAAAAYSLKHTVNSPRPDGTDARSFPSGHAAWAFTGATIMERELGWRSEWYTIGAYAFASGIAMERVIDRHHYPTDVVAGAGIGILATHLGYYINDVIYRDRGLEHRADAPEGDNLNRSVFSLETGLILPMGRIDMGNGVRIKRMPALLTGVRGGFAISDHWGIAVEADVTSAPIVADVSGRETYVAPLTSVGLIVSPYFRTAVSRRVSISGEIGGGYFMNFSLNSIADAVTASGGTPAGRVSAGTTVRLTDHLSAGASVGYEISRYRFRTAPSETYGFDTPSEAKGVSSGILLNISTRYEF